MQSVHFSIYMYFTSQRPLNWECEILLSFCFLCILLVFQFSTPFDRGGPVRSMSLDHMEPLFHTEHVAPFYRAQKSSVFFFLNFRKYMF